MAFNQTIGLSKIFALDIPLSCNFLLYLPTAQREFIISELNGSPKVKYLDDLFCSLIKTLFCTNAGTCYAKLLTPQAGAVLLSHYLIKMTDKQSTASSKINKALVNEFVNSNICERMTNTIMARNLNMSVSKMTSAFKQAYGVTPQRYFTELKMEYAKSLIADSN